MKGLISICFLILLNSYSHAQLQNNISLLSRWDDDSIPEAWTGAYSECWGYAANGREYAFLASTQGTYFFDITDPHNPVMIDFIRTKDTASLVVNKDYATYSHYLYAVSDQGYNSLQIFDLQYLPDSVVKAYDSDILSKRCHTIFVEKDRLYMCSNTRYDNSFHAMDIFSITDPLNPDHIGTLFNPGFFSTHEVYVRNDTAYCANGMDGLWIYDMRVANNPVFISMLENYDENGFNHSAWLTPDGKTLAFTDENHGKGVKLFDATDIYDPQPLSLIHSNLLQVADPLSDEGSVAHQIYIVGNVLLVSYYHDGVAAYDISKPSEPKQIGYYDTYPENSDYYSYRGCWGLYPFLPSGNIIASDIKNGLFILDGKQVLDFDAGAVNMLIAENPFDDELEILYFNGQNSKAVVTITDMSGKLVLRKEFSLTESSGNLKLAMQQVAMGIYVARVESDGAIFTSKILKMRW